MIYLHIYDTNSIIYTSLEINFVNESSLCNPTDHLFLVDGLDVYNEFKHFDNVKYITGIHSDFNIVIDYMKKAAVVFVNHNNFKINEYIRMGKRLRKKIVCRFWGDDLYPTREFPNKTILERTKEKVYFAYKNSRAYYWRDFLGITGSFTPDFLYVFSAMGRMTRIYPSVYSISEVHEKCKATEDLSKPIRIMIGHSAFPFLRHIEILKALERFKNENIEILLVLAYGNAEYAKEVINYAEQAFDKEKLIVITEKMCFDKYSKLLRTVDVVFFAHRYQSALGNIEMLIKNNTAFYLNGDGITAAAFTLAGECYKTIDEFKTESFEQFSNLKHTYGKSIYILENYDKNEYEKTMIEMYRKTLIDINTLQKKNLNC